MVRRSFWPLKNTVVCDPHVPFFALGIDLCGASLIHPDILVTAGHCAEFFREGAWIGGIDIYGRDGTFHEVDSVYAHEEYPGSGAHPHDIALVKLSEPSSITPVPMASLPETPKESTILKVLGYGAMEEDGPVSEAAMEADLKVSQFHFCDQLFGNLLEEFMFCTESPPGKRTDSCQVCQAQRATIRFRAHKNLLVFETRGIVEVHL